MDDVPQPGSERYRRGCHVLWSGRYDHLPAAEARALIDSDAPLDGYTPAPAPAAPDDPETARA